MRKYVTLALLLLSLGLTVKQLFSEIQKVRTLKTEVVALQTANKEMKQGYDEQLASMQAAANKRERDMVELARINNQIRVTLDDVSKSNADWSNTPVPPVVIERMCRIVNCSK